MWGTLVCFPNSVSLKKLFGDSSPFDIQGAVWRQWLKSLASINYFIWSFWLRRGQLSSKVCLITPVADINARGDMQTIKGCEKFTENLDFRGAAFQGWLALLRLKATLICLCSTSRNAHPSNNNNNKSLKYSNEGVNLPAEIILN